jgi:phage terminase large subunit-like protein
MGKRGPKTGTVKAAINEAKFRSVGALPLFESAQVPIKNDLPWEKKGLSRAQRVIAFIERLPITSGMHAGNPLQLRPWQKDIIRAIYRTDRKKRRIVRTALITMPRKQGKTALAAALALCHLIGPEAEPRGQVFSAASDRDQAAIIFRELEAIILAIPEFAVRCNIKSFSKTIEDLLTGSTYQALSSDARKAHGLSPSFMVYDELAQAPNRHLYDNLTTGTGARAEPLMVVISTQSSDPHHIMTELVDYGVKLKEGTLPPDPSFHATIYMAPEEMDPWDEETWFSCNPALNDFRSLEEMRQFAEQAKRIPAKEATFRSLYLNQRVEADQRFIGSADWEACAGGVDRIELEGRPCWAGLDLSSTRDLTALVLYFPHDAGAVLPFFWIPGDRLAEREDKDRVPYWAWINQGFIEALPGRAIDKRAVVFRLAEIASIYDLKGVAYDRWRMEDLQKIMSDEGIEIPFTPWGQGFKDMGPAVDAMEALILDGKLRHGGHPVMIWNVSNAVVVQDPAGARKIAKDRSRDKVDGLVALCMAVGLYSREPEPVEYDFDRPLVLST